MRVDGQARVVNVGEAALLGRSKPDLEAPVQVRFPEGTILTVLEGPVEADGYTWWQVQDEQGNSGWSAERNLEGVIWLQPL
jgi:hypothetical protein